MSPAERIEVANKVLQSFSPKCRIEIRKGGAFVWFDGKSHRWQCRGGDFYPVWSRKYPGGGTSCTALSQLVRWVQGKPVLPISTWRYWATETIRLLPSSAVEELLSGGYPKHVNCVLCGNQIVGGLDWWSLNGVSGPCCHYTSGCRQKGSA